MQARDSSDEEIEQEEHSDLEQNYEMIPRVITVTESSRLPVKNQKGQVVKEKGAHQINISLQAA